MTSSGDARPVETLGSKRVPPNSGLQSGAPQAARA